LFRRVAVQVRHSELIEEFKRFVDPPDIYVALAALEVPFRDEPKTERKRRVVEQAKYRRVLGVAAEQIRKVHERVRNALPERELLARVPGELTSYVLGELCAIAALCEDWATPSDPVRYLKLESERLFRSFRAAAHANGFDDKDLADLILNSSADWGDPVGGGEIDATGRTVRRPPPCPTFVERYAKDEGNGRGQRIEPLLITIRQLGRRRTKPVNGPRFQQTPRDDWPPLQDLVGLRKKP
jgi:hypothetical protein